MAEELQVAEITLANGEIVEAITMETYRTLGQNEQAEWLVKCKKLADFFYVLYNEMEPILRTKMNEARSASTEINQQPTSSGVTVHLGAGLKDQDLGVKEVEDFWEAWLKIDPKGAKECFEEVHKPLKKKITEYRKIKGEEGSMERKRSEMIERFYNPSPKKLELKEK
jgi:hypothetical protein